MQVNQKTVLIKKVKMKNKIMVFLCSLLFISCSEEFESSKQDLNKNAVNQVSVSRRLAQEPCPLGTHPVLSYEFDGIRLHRASADCERRFSICSGGHWEVNCVEDRYLLSRYDSKSDRALVSGVLKNNGQSLELHFPIGLISSPTFEIKDFETFGFDDDFKIYEGVTIKAGEYIPSYTKDEIIVEVALL